MERGTIEEECVNLNEIPKDSKLDIWPIKKGHKFKFLKDETGTYRMIDLGISAVIQALWDNGYKTRFCCEGHNSSGGYIMFESRRKEQELVERVIHNYFEESVSSYLELTIKTKPNIMIRFRSSRPDIDTQGEYKEDIKKILLETIEELS